MKKITVNYLDGQGLIQSITVEVPDDATEAEIQEAINRKLRTSP